MRTGEASSTRWSRSRNPKAGSKATRFARTSKRRASELAKTMTTGAAQGVGAVGLSAQFCRVLAEQYQTARRGFRFSRARGGGQRKAQRDQTVELFSAQLLSPTSRKLSDGIIAPQTVNTRPGFKMLCGSSVRFST